MSSNNNYDIRFIIGNLFGYYNYKFNKYLKILKKIIMSDLNKDLDGNLDAMASAFLHSGEEVIIVKAEDLPLDGSGIDYKKSYFEPQVGKSYTVKLLTNPGGLSITHRSIYKGLPDPKRKGKKFQYVSSGSSKTCKALELFFDLNNLKKNGDPVATLKIENYLGKTNQGCVLVQVLSSPDAEEIGMYRMMSFSTFGPNATIANLIEKKVNPTKEMLANGFEKEDVFSIFGSNALIIQCEEAEYDGVKGRDFSKSEFSKNIRSAYVKYTNENNEEVKYEFSKDDIVDGKIRPEALIPFRELIKQLQNPDISIHNMFAYKTIGDPKNSEDTEKYLKTLEEKVVEIIPIIKNAKTIAEIEQYGAADNSATAPDSATMIGGVKGADILKTSAPSELASSILNDVDTTVPSPKEVAQSANSNPDVNDILNS